MPIEPTEVDQSSVINAVFDVPVNDTPANDTPANTDRIRSLVLEQYGDNATLLQNITKLYKNISTEVLLLHEMSPEDFLKLARGEILTEEQTKTKQPTISVMQKLLSVATFLDTCFIYYMRMIDPTAPVFKLPNTMFKFNIITTTAKMVKQTTINQTTTNQTTILNELYDQFSNIIRDEQFTDVRIEPPYNLRTLDDITEHKKLLSYLLPKCKKLMELIFKLADCNVTK